MAKLLHKGAGNRPERRDPGVPAWVEALRAATFRRVDTLTTADLIAIAKGEDPDEELEICWNLRTPEGDWSNWYGQEWPAHDDEPWDDEVPDPWSPLDPLEDPTPFYADEPASASLPAPGLPDYPDEGSAQEDPTGPAGEGTHAGPQPSYTPRTGHYRSTTYAPPPTPAPLTPAPVADGRGVP